MSSTTLPRPNLIHIVGETVLGTVQLVGDVTLFALNMVRRVAGSVAQRMALRELHPRPRGHSLRY